MGLGLGLGELFGLGMLGYSAARMAGMKRQAEPLEFLFNPFGLGSNDVAQPPTKYTRDDVDYRNPGRMW